MRYPTSCSRARRSSCSNQNRETSWNFKSKRDYQMFKSFSSCWRLLRKQWGETQCVLVQYYYIYYILHRHSCRFHRFPNMQQSSITTDTFLISLIIDTIYISWRLADRFCCHIPDVFLYGFLSASSRFAIKSCRFYIHHILQLCFIRNNVVSLIGKWLFVWLLIFRPAETDSTLY